MKNKKGISLIVLVITIVVIIILAAAVILSLGNNNPINNAKKAKIVQTIDTFKSDLLNTISYKLTVNPDLTVVDIDSKNEDGFRLIDLVPSVKGTEYEEQLVVIDGKLKLKEDTNFPQATQDIIKEVLGDKVESEENETPGTNEPTKYYITYNLGDGVASNPSEYTIDTDTIILNNPTKIGYTFVGWTGSNGSTAQLNVTIPKGSSGDKEYTANWVEGREITPQIVKDNASTYIGKTVTYTGYNTELVNQQIDWKLFGLDKDGNIMLKVNDYVNLNYKETSYPEGIVKAYNSFGIRSTKDRDTLIDYIGNKDNWGEYTIDGKTIARGAMTLPEFVESNNLVNSNKFDIEYLHAGEYSSDNAKKAASDGYAIKIQGKGSYGGYTSDKVLSQSYNGMDFYEPNHPPCRIWFASQSVNSSSLILSSTCNGSITGESYSQTQNLYCGGLCPVVSLTNAKMVESEDGTLVVY